MRFSIGVAAILLFAGCGKAPRVEARAPQSPTIAPVQPHAQTRVCESATLSEKDALDLHMWMSRTLDAWPSMRAEHRSEGEDATSGWDYVRLSDSSGVRLLRVVWNGGAQSLPEVSDYHFRDGRLVTVVERAIAPDAMASYIRGRGDGRSTAVAFAVVDPSGNLAVWLDGHDHAVTTSCDDWRSKEESIKSFASTWP
jgi:hypothetical protein